MHCGGAKKASGISKQGPIAKKSRQKIWTLIEQIVAQGKTEEDVINFLESFGGTPATERPEGFPLQQAEINNPGIQSVDDMPYPPNLSPPPDSISGHLDELFAQFESLTSDTVLEGPLIFGSV